MRRYEDLLVVACMVVEQRTNRAWARRGLGGVDDAIDLVARGTAGGLLRSCCIAQESIGAERRCMRSYYCVDLHQKQVEKRTEFRLESGPETRRPWSQMKHTESS